MLISRFLDSFFSSHLLHPTSNPSGELVGSTLNTELGERGKGKESDRASLILHKIRCEGK
jgi:hypothetical protein